MEDPQPQQADIIVEASAPDLENVEIVDPIVVGTNAKVFEDNESHQNVKTDHTENAEAQTSSVDEENDFIEAAVPEIKSKEEIEQVEEQTSQPEKAEDNNSEVIKNSVEGEESNNNAESVEEPPQVNPQQTEQSQNAEVEPNNTETEVNEVGERIEQSENAEVEPNNKEHEAVEQTKQAQNTEVESNNQEAEVGEQTQNAEIKPNNEEHEVVELTEQAQNTEAEPNNQVAEVSEVKEQAQNAEVKPDNEEYETLEQTEQAQNTEVESNNQEAEVGEQAQNTEVKPNNEEHEAVEQTEQIQNSEAEPINDGSRINKAEGHTLQVKINIPSQSDKIKEVPEEEETEEIKEQGSASSGMKDRHPKLNLLRIKTQAKHIEDSSEDVKGTAESTNIANIEAQTQGEESEKKEENSNKFGSSSIRKVQSQSDMAYPSELESNAQKVMKPAPLKRVGSHNNGLGKVDDSAQPNSAATPSKSRVSMEDFQKITSVGRGSYGEVFLVKKISNNKLYALKAIDKNFMKKERKEHQVYVEREVLLKLNHPNIIKLYSSFQDKNKLYFVLEYASGGEFSDYLRVQGKLSKDQIIFFTAEMINILEYIHTSGIAHRDLKPENILLTQEGHLKCIDFGTARYLTIDKRTAELYDIKNKAEDTLEGGPSQIKKNHRTTFVGTAQYVSPEMLDGADTGASADLWALGCMLYLMATGQFAFIDMNEYLIFQKIKAVTVKYPDDMDLEIKDLIQKLLIKDPELRLGAGEKGSKNDYEALKGHSLFRGVQFSNLHEQIPPVIEIASPHKRKSYDYESTSVGTSASNNRKHFNSDDLSRSNSRGEKTVDYTSDKGIRVIISGLVLKKCGWWFYRPRQLILNSKPKLVYYDPDSNQLKGEIFLAPTTKAELESKTKFTITTPTRKFTFKEMEHSAEKWVEIINTTVAQLYSKKGGN